jgi:hypothetical protein
MFVLKTDIVSYQDQAEATLEVLENGSGRFIEVRLFPQVIIRNKIKLLKHYITPRSKQTLLYC